MEPNIVLRKLRKERNVSQIELSKGVSTRNTLGSYEQKGTSINYYVLRQYLEKLNVSIEEFDYLISPNKENYKKFMSTTLEKLYYNQNYKNCLQLLSDIKNKYDATQDFYFLHLVAQYRLALHKEKVIHLDNEEIDFFIAEIKRYLEKIETWGQFEIAVFINTMHIFDTEYIIQMIANVCKKKSIYSTLYKKYHILEKMYLNTLYLLFERREVQLVPGIINSFWLIIDKDDLKSKVIISFLEGIVENDEPKRRRALQILRTFDMDSHADYLSSLCQKSNLN